MHYVLIFPNGEHGWTFHRYHKRERPHLAIPQQVEEPQVENDLAHVLEQEDNQGGNDPAVPAVPLDGVVGMGDVNDGEEEAAGQKYVSARQFYAYQLQIRPISATDLHCYIWLFGRLILQFVVDMYVKIESQRLLWVTSNQRKLCADVYQGVVDAILNDANAVLDGVRVVLPSSFTGSPRQMNQLFQDSMAIVRTFGKPDLFITFTCNPNWREILEQLDPGQTPSDRPDLCV